MGLVIKKCFIYPFFFSLLLGMYSGELPYSRLSSRFWEFKMTVGLVKRKRGDVTAEA